MVYYCQFNHHPYSCFFRAAFIVDVDVDVDINVDVAVAVAFAVIYCCYNPCCCLSWF